METKTNIQATTMEGLKRMDDKQFSLFLEQTAYHKIQRKEIAGEFLYVSEFCHRVKFIELLKKEGARKPDGKLNFNIIMGIRFLKQDIIAIDHELRDFEPITAYLDNAHAFIQEFGEESDAYFNQWSEIEEARKQNA